MTALTERFEMRLDEESIGKVDEWANNKGIQSRAEAIRTLIHLGLEVESDDSVHFTDGEKVLLLMMGDIYDHLGLATPEVDPEFVADVIYGGHYWAPIWEWSGVFHRHRDDAENVKFVVDVLDMWNFIERAHEQLSDAEKEQLKSDAEPFGEHVRFTGFDGNHESELMGIARFLVEKMGRFSRFSGREMNSHCPTIGAYQRMLDEFEPIRANLVGRELSVTELTKILTARLHPGE